MMRYNSISKAYSLAVPAISGSLAGVNRLISNGIAIGLKMTFQGDGCFCVEWLWYLLTIGTLLSWLSQLKWLIRGLSLFSPLHIMPIQSTCSILVATMAGLVVFEEWNEFSGLSSIIVFAFGIVPLLVELLRASYITVDANSQHRQHCNEQFWARHLVGF